MRGVLADLTSDQAACRRCFNGWVKLVALAKQQKRIDLVESRTFDSNNGTKRASLVTRITSASFNSIAKVRKKADVDDDESDEGIETRRGSAEGTAAMLKFSNLEADKALK